MLACCRRIPPRSLCRPSHFLRPRRTDSGWSHFSPAGSKNLLSRAIGPRLADLGVGGVLADPRFEVFRAGAAVAVAGNDNWDASLAATFASVGAFSLTAGSRDAALVTALTPGS